MERLTDRGYKGRAFMKEPVENEEERTVEIIERLAAYEDTGIEPEEIKQMCALARLNSNIFDNDFGNHIAELIVAEQDGRLLVLPCPFYSEVYALSQVGNEIIHGELRSTNKDYCLIVNSEGSLTSKGKTWHGVQVRMQDVFPTRPEA